MNEKTQIQLKLLYFRVTDVWKDFCELHTELLDLTFKEYSCLLSSDIDGVESLINDKNDLIEKISSMDKMREIIINELNELLSDQNQKTIENVSELISVMNIFEKHNNLNHLSRFNALLIDLIEKLQEQNKKNQVFLNKAIHSLKDIREEALGIKKYSTYNQKGVSVKQAR